MSEQKHTSGPWTVGQLRGNDGSHRVMSPIGRIGTVDYRGSSTKRIISDAPDAEGAANAHLIAASPTMFDYISKRAQSGDLEAAEIIKGIYAKG